MSDSVNNISDVEFGVELPSFAPDTSLENVKHHGEFIGWGSGRFVDHEIARSQGFPGRDEAGFPRRDDSSMGTERCYYSHRHGI